MLSNDFQDALAIFFYRKGNVKVSDAQREQAREEFCVIDVRAVRRITVASGTSMNPNSLALFGRKPRQRQVVQSDKPVEQVSGGIQFYREAALGEIDLHF